MASWVIVTYRGEAPLRDGEHAAVAEERWRADHIRLHQARLSAENRGQRWLVDAEHCSA